LPFTWGILVVVLRWVDLLTLQVVRLDTGSLSLSLPSSATAATIGHKFFGPQIMHLKSPPSHFKKKKLEPQFLIY